MKPFGPRSATSESTALVERSFEIAMIVVARRVFVTAGDFFAGMLTTRTCSIYVDGISHLWKEPKWEDYDDEGAGSAEIIFRYQLRFRQIFADLLARTGGLSLLLAGRDEVRLNAVAQRVRHSAPGSDVELVVGDLGAGSGVDALAAPPRGTRGRGAGQ